jgi:hypothetical protein
MLEGAAAEGACCPDPEDILVVLPSAAFIISSREFKFLVLTNLADKSGLLC